MFVVCLGSKLCHAVELARLFGLAYVVVTRNIIPWHGR